MADDPNPNAPKKETVRINIPPATPTGGPGAAPEPVKRETVRINLPSKPGGTGPIPPPPPPSKPFVPPPPAPKPPSAAVPPSAPKPPTGPVKPPTGPMRPPGQVSSPSAPSADVPVPVTMKAATPKKETARIQLPPDPKPLPKATVRMQQTQPLSATPAATITKASLTHAPAPVSGGDSGGVGIAAAALLLSGVAFGFQLWALLG